ncbi:MAG: hypothetical protein EZS28_047563, partial [Streblomastix strix]
TRVTSAEGISWLYNGIELPANMKSGIIEQINIGLKSKDTSLSVNTGSALLSLARSEGNHSEILKDRFISQAQEILQNIDVQFQYNLLCAYIALIENGTLDTLHLFKQQLPIQIIRDLSSSKDSDVREKSACLLSYISNRTEMIKFNKILQEIQNKNTKELTTLANNGLMKEMSDVLREGLDNFEDKRGLIILICQISEVLLENNDDLGDLIVQDNGFVDQLFNLYQQLPLESISKQIASPIISIINTTEADQRLKLKCEKYLIVLSRLMSSKSEYVVFCAVVGQAIILSQLKQNYYQIEDDAHSVMLKNGQIHKLIEAFKSNHYQNVDIKRYAAIAIALLHKAIPVLPVDFRKELISYLKKIAILKDN